MMFVVCALVSLPMGANRTIGTALDVAIPLLMIVPLLAKRPDTQAQTRTTQSQREDDATRTRFPWQLVVGFLVFGVAFGLSRSITPQTADGISLSQDLVRELNRGTAGIVAIALILRSHNLTYSLGVAGTFCFVVVFFLAYFVEGSHDAVSLTAVNAFSTLGYSFFELIMWSVIFSVASETSQPFHRIYGTGRGIMQLGVILGMRAATAERAVIGGDPFMPLFQASVLAMLLVFVGCFGTRDVLELWGMRKVSLPASEGSDDLASLISREFGLTPRESQVAVLLTKGRSESFIAESLSISQSTVHGHVTNIYAKTGVHSRQEFLTLVESASQGKSR